MGKKERGKRRAGEGEREEGKGNGKGKEGKEWKEKGKGRQGIEEKKGKGIIQLLDLKLLKLKLSFDPACLSVGWSVCHNFL